MKNFMRKMVSAICLLVAMAATAEAQNSFAYQAVIRTAKGELVSNQEVGMRISLIYNDQTIYSETHTPKTNQYGNVQVKVGEGTVEKGSFAAVPWSTMQVMMKIEADPNGGTNYIDLGSIQLQPAPYAMYAPTAGAVSTVQAGDPKSDSAALFEVKDKDGNVVFAVYPDGVRVFVNDSDSTKAARTGFAVQGRRAAKDGEEANYFEVTADGTQVFVEETDTAAGKAARTGFAVSGRRAAKDVNADLFTVGSSGTQVYIDEDAAKAARTGFAVQGRRAAKDGDSDKYLEINPDGTRVYIDNEEDSTKAVRTGFAVQGRRAAKDDADSKIFEINADGTRVYVDDEKAVRTGFAVQGRRAAKGSTPKLFEVNSYGTQIYIETEGKPMSTGFAVSGRRAAKGGQNVKYLVIDADGTRIYVDYDEAKAMRTGFAVSGRKAAKDGEQNTILEVNNQEGTRAYVDDIEGKAMPTGFAVSGRKAAKDGEPDLLRITSEKSTLTATNFAMQDKQTNNNMMSITPETTKLTTDELRLLSHDDSEVLSTTSGNVDVKTELVVTGEVAQTVEVKKIDIHPVYLAVGEKIDTVLCADTASVLEAPNGYVLLKIYGNGLFAPSKTVDVEGNSVILFDGNGNPTTQHDVAAAAVIMTKASTPDAKLIIWPLKQANVRPIRFGLMAAGDTTKQYVPVEAFLNSSGPVECLVDVKSAVDSLGTVAVVGPKVYGEKVKLTPQPIDGYHFTGWSDGRTINPRTVLILHDTAFASANFEINTYNIKAIAENGTVEISGEQNEDGTYNHGTDIALTAFAAEHYHFMGWTDGDTAAVRKFKIVSDTTFEAAFAIDSFSISTLAENGTVTGAGRYPYGTEIELVAIADTLAGYHFANWSDGDNTNPRKIKVQKNIDLTAQFAINHYTIAYKLDDEVYGEIEDVAYNEPIALREAPQKEGYTFSGWSKIPATMPMGNVTVTGSFAINHHTITYMVDGDVYKKFENIPYASELSVIDNPEDKEGYTFSEWCELPVTMPDEDVVVTGSFIINEYEIAFVDFDGKVLQSGNVEYGQTPEYVGENPAQAATAQYTFKFNGWMPETKPVNGPLTYTAVYDTTVNQYAVSVVAENGSVKATTANGNEIENGKKVDYNTEVTLTATSSVSGYYFIRWSDGVTDNPRTFNIVKDTAFTAVYKKDFTADGLKYILTSASTVSVGKIDDDNKPTGELTIPATVKDGDGIQYYVTIVKSYAFDECKDLTEVIISEGVMRIDYNAFYDCSSLTSVTIPNSVTSIGEEAFYYCHKLKSVTIPNSVTSIGQKAFCACDSLTSANIPANVTSVGYGAFGSCDKLERIYVDAENANYISLDGVLYSKDTTQLVQYPQGKQDTLYVVHDSVKTISQNAFLSCMNLKYVAIPYGVTKIEMYSFYNCWKLKTTLPSSCVSVGSRAFYNTGDSDNSGQTVYCQAENAPSTSTEKTGRARFVYENCKAIKLVSANNELGTATFATPGGMGADGSTWFAAGTEIELIANPVLGYELESFKVGETVIEPTTDGLYKYTVTTDATITAVFKVKSFTVNFNLNGGTGTFVPQTVEYGLTATEPGTAPTREGYKFLGWYGDEDYKHSFYFTGAITSDTTIYAKWGQYYAKVGGTLYYDKGSTISAISQVSEDVTIELYSAVKAGDLGNIDEPNTIIYTIAYIQSQIGVTLVVPEGANIELEGDCSGLFRGLMRLVSADLRGLNTGGVTDMNSMFFDCKKLESLDVSGFNTEKVTDMNQMFYGCSKLTELDLSSFNTGNVTSMAGMFQGCSKLTELDVSGFNTEKVTDMDGMFWDCSALTTIYAASGANWSGVGSSENMFTGCENLKGGNNTEWSNDYTDATRAKIDDGEGNDGYFTTKPISYYIKPNGGNDSNSGLSATEPLQSLTGALIKMKDATTSYTLYIDGTLTGKQSISPQIINGQHHSVSAKSLILCGLTSDAKIDAGCDENNTGSALSIGQAGFPITITNLTVTGGYTSNGGGISFFNMSGYDCTLTLAEGAVITGNTATGCGGGIYIQDGPVSLVINGGTVSGNNAAYGGGVYYGNGSGSFTMNSGTISGNTANEGGGVYIARTFDMKGGEISENTAQSGGAVYYGSYGCLYMSGNAKIPFGVNGQNEPGKNDVYLVYNSSKPEDIVIKVDGELFGTGTVATITTDVWHRGMTVLTASTDLIGGITNEIAARFALSEPDFSISTAISDNQYIHPNVGIINAPIYVASANSATRKLCGEPAATNTIGTKNAPLASMSQVANLLAEKIDYTILIDGEIIGENAQFAISSSLKNPASVLLKGVNGDNSNDKLDRALTTATENGSVINIGANISRFEIQDLTITGGNTTGNGGGISIWCTSLCLGKGVLITGNQAEGNGGGVYVSTTSKLFMYGDAKIGDGESVAGTGSFANKAKNGGGVSAKEGGSVYLGYVGLDSENQPIIASGDNVFTGGIFRNYATENGGGMSYETTAGVYNMAGGSVSSNAAASNGGGVYIPEDKAFNMSGSAVVNSNNDVYLTSGTKVTIVGPLSNNNVATITPSSYVSDQIQIIQIPENVTSTKYANEYYKFAVTPNSDNSWFVQDNGTFTSWQLYIREENDSEHPCVLSYDESFRCKGELAGFPEVYVGSVNGVTSDRDYYITMRGYHRKAPNNNGSFLLHNTNANTMFTFHITLEGDNTIERTNSNNYSGSFEIIGKGSGYRNVKLIFDANTSGTLNLNGDPDFKITGDSAIVTYEVADGCTFSGTIGSKTYSDITEFFNNAKNHPNGCSFTISRGAIYGKFSVSDDKQVYFSKGNLQYQASTNTWRFAENQYDYVGSANTNISNTYTGWIDYFGWGTSGYNNKYPYMTSDAVSDYGDGENNIAGTEYDWGKHNAISNGGNQAGLWRTLTKEEWAYMLENESRSGKYGFGKVESVNGLILLPDDWTHPTDISSSSSQTFTSGKSDSGTSWPNTYTAADWAKMQAAGAVFLPAAGFRTGTAPSQVGNMGDYWLATANGSSKAYRLYFTPTDIDNSSDYNRNLGFSVRLVRDK